MQKLTICAPRCGQSTPNVAAMDSACPPLWARAKTVTGCIAILPSQSRARGHAGSGSRLTCGVEAHHRAGCSLSTQILRTALSSPRPASPRPSLAHQEQRVKDDGFRERDGQDRLDHYL